MDTKKKDFKYFFLFSLWNLTSICFKINSVNLCRVLISYKHLIIFNFDWIHVSLLEQSIFWIFHLCLLNGVKYLFFFVLRIWQRCLKLRFTSWHPTNSNSSILKEQSHKHWPINVPIYKGVATKNHRATPIQLERTLQRTFLN